MQKSQTYSSSNLQSHQTKISQQLNHDDVRKVYRRNGVKLTDEESKTLLSHFFMIVVGKPGSGKTTVIERLLTRQGGYHKKFDFVFLISPSKNKMGIDVPEANSNTEFSLQWVYSKISMVNEITAQELDKHLNDIRNGMTGPYDTHAKVVRNNLQNNFKFAPSVTTNEQQNNMSTFIRAALVDKRVIKTRQMGEFEKEKEQKSVYHELFVNKRQKKAAEKDKQNMKREGRLGRTSMLGQNAGAPIARQVVIESNDLEKEMMKHYTTDQLNAKHKNILFIFDDVIGTIKEMQFDQYLAQLFFNRRHLLANGTVSVMLVSQKYSMIPSRLRSNASWLIMFKLNPNDNRMIYEDVFTGSQDKWESLLRFVFGDQDADLSLHESKEKNHFKFNNLGVWIEKDKYFKNFEQITMNQL